MCVCVCVCVCVCKTNKKQNKKLPEIRHLVDIATPANERVKIKQTI